METEETKKYLSIALTILLILLLVKIFDISFPVSVTTMTRSGELAVVGEGKIDISPDTAYVDAGIFVNGSKTVSEAQNTINNVNNAIVNEMKNLGIKKEDIKTSNYSISPDYTYESGKSRINGYNGNVTISIKTINLTLVPQVIEAATKAGANQVQGARFVIDNPQKFREQVRDEAIKNAKDQAARLAKSLGLRLGRITNIVEATPNTPYAYMDKAAPMAAGLGGASNQPFIEPGTQTLSSSVTLYFEKK